MSTQVSETIYLSSIFLYFVFLCLQNSEFTTLYIGLDLLCSYIYFFIILLLLFKLIFFTKFAFSHLCLSAFFLVCGLLVYRFTHDNVILTSFIFICSGIDIEIHKIALAVSRSLLLAVSMIFLFTLFGVLPNRVTIRVNPFSDVFKYRHYMGFLNVNVLGGFILAFSISFLCFHYVELSMRHLIFIFSLALFTLFYVNSNTPALTILLIIVFYCFYSYCNSKTVRYCISIGVLVFSLAFSFFFPNFNGAFFDKLNFALANRLAYSAYFLKHYSVTLFGQQIKLISTADASSNGESPLVLDNSYLHCFIHYGLIVTLIFISIYLYLLLFCIKNSNIILLSIVTAVLICSISENWLYRINIVIIVFLFARKTHLRALKYKAGFKDEIS